MEIGAGGDDSWRRRSKESSHLRDFIQLKEEEEDDARRNSLTGQTLSDVLGEPHRPPPSLPVQSNRTLLDIIREEDHHPNRSYNNNTANKRNKTSWKAFTEKLRLSRTITATVHIPNPNRRSTSQTQPNNGLQSSNNTPDLDLGRESLSDLLLRSSETNGSNQQAVITLVNSSSGETVQGVGMSLMALLEGDNGEREPAADVGISLMALLAETDREIGLEGSTTPPPILAYEEDEDDEEEQVLEDEIEGGEVVDMNLMNRCCVCMVRHKGAAFIPCGHAFCRICSRELWVQRGSCPLCNGLIVEILDIF